MSTIDPYLFIQHLSLEQTLALVEEHAQVQSMEATDIEPSPSSKDTIPIPTSPTVPTKKVAA